MSSLVVDIFGESHAEKIGVRVKGLPKGTKIDMGSIKKMLLRRGANVSPWSTPRKERDEVIFTNGVEDNVVVGSEVTAIIYNENVRPTDYDNVLSVPRPSHADYVSFVKYGKIFSGGGKFSARLTAPLCIVGAIVKDLLLEKGIKIGAYVSSIAHVQGRSYKNSEISLEEIENAQKQSLPTLSNEEEMIKEVLCAKADLDSVGGTVECIVYGLPVGIGDNLFGGMESAISSAVFGVPAVKGIEFGSGFDICALRGSEANDAFKIEDGKVITLTNHSGGINGGITNGMPLTLRVALRPTPSIGKEQQSVDLVTMQNTTISVKGRHDTCIVPRAVSAIESAVAIAIYSKMLDEANKDE